MSDSAAPTGTLEVAMAQALRLLDQDPALAFEIHRIEMLSRQHALRHRIRVLQQAIRKSGLSMIDVSDDTKISRIFFVHQRALVS